ncbi:hypothetical protein ACIGNX_00785 [Actinosynnema sp. NPDC053489]|uniref:hypothetical protein n=1 Tax=Actinosynnema sp. NPDC053489 TaxID=3363916 RepID=UPI0037CA428F
MVGVQGVAARRFAGSGAGRLAEHLPRLRAELEEQRRFRVEQLAGLDRAGREADQARREVAAAVAEAARQALADVEAALALVELGGYGRCVGCRDDIPLRLLLTIPASRWCLDCRRHGAPGPEPHVVPRGRRATRGTSTGRRHHGTRRTAAR